MEIGKHTVQAVSNSDAGRFLPRRRSTNRFVLCRFGGFIWQWICGDGCSHQSFVNPLFLCSWSSRLPSVCLLWVEVGIEHGKGISRLCRRLRRHPHPCDKLGNIRILLGVMPYSLVARPNTFLHVVQLKVRAEQLIVDIELPVLQFMGIVRQVPRHQVEVFSFRLACQGLHFTIFLFWRWACKPPAVDPAVYTRTHCFVPCAPWRLYSAKLS